ncbi:hypothetical protein [Aerococcus urinaeequi]|uniref:hypothetical protein n=1 Tax=Aerococcus urinaeequi TaxID=51665 RepID=UPI003D6A060A
MSDNKNTKYRSFHLKLPENLQDSFTKQSNYLATNRSTFAQILFYCGKDKPIEKEKLDEYYQLVGSGTALRYLNVGVTKQMVDDISKIVRYEYSLSFIWSYIIYREFLKSTFPEISEMNKAKGRQIYLPDPQNQAMQKLKKDYRISFSTLINYGLLQGWDKKTIPIKSKSSNKMPTEKSILIVPQALELLEKEHSKRTIQAVNIINHFIH